MTHRVAMISEHASPVALLGGVDAGGQNVYVDAVSRGVVAHGYETDIFIVRQDPSSPEIIAWADGVRVVTLAAGPETAVPKDALWPLMPAFRDGIACFARAGGIPYDLIHGNFWMSGWVAAELGALWSVPVVQIFHAMGVTKRREQGAADTSPPERIAIETSIVRGVDRLIAQCPSERDELIDEYDAPAERIALIPSAVDIDRFYPVAQGTARAMLGIDPAAEVIVYVGRVIPRKDIRNVVRALAQLKDRRAPRGAPLPILIVVGGETAEPDPVATPEIGVLQALAAELGVAGQVRFPGCRQPDELHLWYGAADVAVTTPWYEPFGLTPLEAMACGRPVIGSRVGGIAFTIADGETGWLVPPRDPEALCQRLDDALGDPAKSKRMGRAGRVRVLDSFTWQHVAARTAALYDDLLADHNWPLDHHRPDRAAGLAAAGRSRSAGVTL
jgi:D-inositol-3-phosphate glycosyltransferase